MYRKTKSKLGKIVICKIPVDWEKPNNTWSWFIRIIWRLWWHIILSHKHHIFFLQTIITHVCQCFLCEFWFSGVTKNDCCNFFICIFFQNLYLPLAVPWSYFFQFKISLKQIHRGQFWRLAKPLHFEYFFV